MMFIHRRRDWDLPESSASAEHAVLGRRGIIAGAMAVGAAATLAAPPAKAQFASFFGGGPSVKPQVLRPLPAPLDSKYVPGRAITPEKAATTYNNFYEFGTDKSIWQAAQALQTDPWSIAVAGMVEKPFTIGFEDLMKKVTLEQRVYRHRCVEAWAMTVPWTGFPVSDLLKIAKPLSSAKYIVFTTKDNPKTMPGVHQSWYPWPYIDGLTMQEAVNQLTFMSVGMFGKTMPPQDGAPIRLTVPWKYGFKSVKSIVKVTFTDKQPVSFWQSLQSSEYGFWANVNPAVPHPRWSQASERLLGSNEQVPTQIWNGYGEYVAAMYADKTNLRLFA